MTDDHRSPDESTGPRKARPMTGSAISGAPPHVAALMRATGSVTERQRDQPERTDDDAPPGEHCKAVALHVSEK